MPTVSMLESRIKRINNEILQLEKQRARAVSDEHDSIKKINSAKQTISRTKSEATVKSKLRDVERENGKIQKSKSKEADALKKLSSKNIDLVKATSELSSLRHKEQAKLFKEQEDKLSQYEKEKNDLTSLSASNNNIEPPKEYDVFISHSAEDKDDYVEDLVKQLEEAGVKTWYDTKDIPWGGSIRQSIDTGLSASKFGIVILSPSFIEKHWTNYELDGILTKQSVTGRQVILPIWHKVTANDIQNKSLSLSNLKALNTALTTTEEVVESVQNLLKN